MDGHQKPIPENQVDLGSSKPLLLQCRRVGNGEHVSGSCFDLRQLGLLVNVFHVGFGEIHELSYTIEALTEVEIEPEPSLAGRSQLVERHLDERIR